MALPSGFQKSITWKNIYRRNEAGSGGEDASADACAWELQRLLDKTSIVL